MRFTKMDRKITIREIQTEKTSTGGTKKVGTNDLFTTWGSLEPMTGSKRMEYTSVRNSEPFEIFIAYRPETITANMEAVIDGVVYQIMHVFIDSDKKFIHLEVEK
jgi:SPP1 family predicted phage head-tail adaptor